ncbi:hypothetical protein MK366_10250 [Streptococcus sanguinis]|uniref:hypothetical protein n=1 Tax=Streptococcus sanguinis TaxID=1305 RepID=UPI0022834835|nr:hypothetical protein [Streptococcus sanguinis]MCY7018017.1 hypothetical protein [Streptococcus sanguinis]
MTRYYLADEKFIRSPLKETARIFGLKRKLDKMNNLHFKEKIVIIDFLLYVYIQILEKKLQSSRTQNKFSFEILKQQHRLVLFSEEKFFSVALPFEILSNNGNFYLKSSKYKEEITIESLRILKILFDRIIIEDLSLSLLDYAILAEDIYKDYCEDNGIVTTNKDVIEKLLLELLEYESSYIRFDIDFKNCRDEKGKMTDARIGVHPPYHFDTDFRDSVSFKIGMDYQLVEEDFKNIFFADEDCLFIKKGYKPNVSYFRRK